MSIASRITSIEGHISDIYDSVELTGVDTTDIDKNLVNVPNTLKEGYIDIINNGTDTLYNNFPKVSGEGSSLTLNNTYQAPMRNNLKGNTSQTGTPTPTSPIPVNVVSGDNSIVVCGKNLLNPSNCTLFISSKYISTINYSTKGAIKVEPNTSYVFIIDKNISLPDMGVYEFDINNSNKATMTRTAIGSNVWNTQKVTTSATTHFISFYRGNGNGTAYSSVSELLDVTKFMLVKEADIPSTLSGYEPYQGNTYNIDLPVENLLDLTQVTLIGSGSTQSNVQTNSITLNGKSAWSNTYFFITNTFKNTNYTASCKAFSSIARKSGLSIYGANDTSGSGMTSINGVTEDMSANVSKTYINSFNSGNYEYLAIRFWTNATGTSLDSNVDLNISEIMLEIGTKVNTFVPYGTTPIELCKIGNYQDYIYKDSDKWYLHKEIKKVVLNGSETTWARADGNNDYRDFRIPLSDIALANTDPIGYIDNRFVAKTASYWNENGEHLVQMNDKRLSFRIAVSRLADSTRESWISWLTNNHITTYYALATPTNTEITDTTLINQLEELYIAKSKENQTNISQINNDLGFIISASALKKG